MHRGGCGSWIKILVKYGPAIEMDGMATDGFAKARFSEKNTVDALMDKVMASKTSPVEALLVYNANPCHTLKNTKAVTEAVKENSPGDQFLFLHGRNHPACISGASQPHVS